MFEPYLKKGLLKRQRVNFKQVEKQIARAKKDLETASSVLANDPEWAATIAYHDLPPENRANCELSLRVIQQGQGGPRWTGDATPKSRSLGF